MSDIVYEEYLKGSLEKLLNCIKEMQCSPILFVGSGLSLRYMNTPTWRGLVESNPLIKRPLSYYIMDNKVNEEDNLPKVAAGFIPYYFDYAWSEDAISQNIFPQSLYSDGQNKDIYLKTEAVDIINNYFVSFRELFRNHEHPYIGVRIVFGYRSSCNSYNKL